MPGRRQFCLTCAALLSGCAGSRRRPPAGPPRFPRPLPRLDREPEVRVQMEDGEILTLPMETYLKGVVSAEIPTRWGVEEKKAQAIAARSYALARLGGWRRYDVLSTTLDQVYRPRENEGAVTAVEETRGQVLVDERSHELIEAFYHSTCGGRTENAKEVWPRARPYRWATTCETCAASPRYRWEVTVSEDAIARALPGVERLDALELTARAASGRVLEVTVVEGDETRAMDAPVFRRAVGTATLRSTFFETEKRDDQFLFSGRGFGHGVGMCQWGAHGMIEAGAAHLAVLAHYYRRTRVHLLYA